MKDLRSFLVKSSLSLGAAAFLTFAGAAHTPLLSSVFAADTIVNDTMTTWGGGNTYVVDSVVTIEDRITVSGDVTLKPTLSDYYTRYKLGT